MMKLPKFLYSIKTKDGYRVVRILGFKRKKKIANVEQMLAQGTDSTAVLYVPPIAHIGKQSYGNDDLEIIAPNTRIGSFCSIGRRCVLGHGEHPVDFLSSSPYLYFDVLGYKKKEMRSHNEFWDIKPITIGSDVWIGDGVFVKNGITIGDGAIIGARAVVTKDVPPYAIAVGSPAKVLRYRFSPEIIQQLLELKWWDLPDKVIKKIPYDDINQAIEFLQKQRKAQ